jgi:hypothetical protein
MISLVKVQEKNDLCDLLSKVAPFLIHQGVPVIK